LKQSREGHEEIDETSLLKLQDRILRPYPFAAATVETAVKRVSNFRVRQAQAEREEELFVAYDAASAEWRQASRHSRRASTLSAADIGSAHHRFLELVALDRVCSLDQLQEQVLALADSGALLPEEAAALNLKALLSFWTSPIGKQILSRKDRVQREIPFTARFSSEDFTALNLDASARQLPGEFFIVRGVADLVVLLPEQIWLLDFKTDFFGPEEAEERIQRYAPQLKLYASALARIYRRPVTCCWLHFLELGQTIEIKHSGVARSLQPLISEK
jgi:ATP-dependent helicase/nuclease subunit A